MFIFQLSESETAKISYCNVEQKQTMNWKMSEGFSNYVCFVL